MRAVDLDDDSVTYTRYRPPEPFTAADVARSGVKSALRGAAVTESWNESGTEFARLGTNESETRRVRASNGTAVNATTRRTATATVRADGFVPRIEWTITGHRPLPSSVGADGVLSRVRDETRVRYTDLGSTTVDRPAWVDDALAATADPVPSEPRSPAA
jgi:hypothetical protein